MEWLKEKNFGMNQKIKWFLGHGGVMKMQGIIEKQIKKQRRYLN